MKDHLKVKGDLKFVFTDTKTGKTREFKEKNLVVTVGKNHIADQLAEASQGAISHMAVGTDTTAADVANTALGGELDRNALASVAAMDNTVTYVSDWAAGDGTGALTEAGLFNAAGGGSMLSRAVFSVKNKGAADSLTITWVLTIS